MNVNENMRDRKLQRAFASVGLLKITQLVLDKTLLVSYIKGSKQICSAWVSLNMILTAVSTFPHYFRVGDYRSMVLDFLRKLFVRDGLILIYCLKMRCLTIK